MPESKRKIILWVIVVVLGLTLLFFWSRKVQNNLGNFKIEQVQENLNLPNLEMPDFNLSEVNNYEEEEQQQ
ncbi:MAG: hypothetical protein FJZ05_02105 [Candidatus Nealsonbacteria bacterium]|nr:hypothetical protein [Candidatus Nealsonbacteria bacterium]